MIDLRKPPPEPVDWEITWESGCVTVKAKLAFDAHKKAQSMGLGVPSFGACTVRVVEGVTGRAAE